MGTDGLSVGERAIDDLLDKSHFAAEHQLPAIVAEHAALLDAHSASIYLADLQQVDLVHFTDAQPGTPIETLSIDGTLAGRAFQLMTVLTQRLDDSTVRVWLPIIDGTERVGVLAVEVPAAAAVEIPDGLLGIRLRRFATMVAELVMTRTMYGDAIVRLRRRAPMDLAAELQWSLLPPLTFSTGEITVCGALEPAYEVAGDTLDYAIDDRVMRAAVFDSMGHGLQSGQLAAIAVAAYRNARRDGADLQTTAERIDAALLSAFGGEQFVTAVLTELATDTGRLRWVCAGHPPPMLLRDGRAVHELDCRPAPPLGLPTAMHSFNRVEVCEVSLQPGDRVLLYTDGVLEARSPDGEFFGERRLLDLLGRHFASGLPVPETMRRVTHALLDHQQGRLTDDATMLLLEWRTDVEAMRY